MSCLCPFCLFVHMCESISHVRRLFVSFIWRFFVPSLFWRYFSYTSRPCHVRALLCFAQSLFRIPSSSRPSFLQIPPSCRLYRRCRLQDVPTCRPAPPSRLPRPAHALPISVCTVTSFPRRRLAPAADCRVEEMGRGRGGGGDKARGGGGWPSWGEMEP